MIRGWTKKWRLWGGSSGGLACLGLAFQAIPLADVGVALRSTNTALVALGLFSVLLTNGAKTERWRLLFHPRHRNLRWRSCFVAIMVGQMLNILVPWRVGELARAYMIGETEGESKAYALGTIVIEKLVDVVMLGLVSSVLVWLLVLPDWFRGPSVLVMLAPSMLRIFGGSTTIWRVHLLGSINVCIRRF